MEGAGEGVKVPVCCDCASVTLNLSFDKRFQCRAGRWLHYEGGGGSVIIIIIITDLLFVPVHFLQTHCCMGIVTQRMTMAVRVHDECEIFVLYFANEDQSLYII